MGVLKNQHSFDLFNHFQIESCIKYRAHKVNLEGNGLQRNTLLQWSIMVTRVLGCINVIFNPQIIFQSPNNNSFHLVLMRSFAK